MPIATQGSNFQPDSPHNYWILTKFIRRKRERITYTIHISDNNRMTSENPGKQEH